MRWLPASATCSTDAVGSPAPWPANPRQSPDPRACGGHVPSTVRPAGRCMSGAVQGQRLRARGARSSSRPPYAGSAAGRAAARSGRPRTPTPPARPGSRPSRAAPAPRPGNRAATSASAASSSAREPTTSDCGLAQAPELRVPRPGREVRLDLVAAQLAPPVPSTRTCRATWCHGNTSAARGFAARSAALAEPRLVKNRRPRPSYPLSSTVRAAGAPSAPDRGEHHRVGLGHARRRDVGEPAAERDDRVRPEVVDVDAGALVDPPHGGRVGGRSPGRWRLHAVTLTCPEATAAARLGTECRP